MLRWRTRQSRHRQSRRISLMPSRRRAVPENDGRRTLDTPLDGR